MQFFDTYMRQQPGAFRRDRRAPHTGWQFIVCALLLAVAPWLAITPAHAVAPATGGGGTTQSLTISVPASLSGPAGTGVTVSGNHWTPGTTVTIAVGSATGGCGTTTSVAGAAGQVDGNGAIQVTFAWPSLPNGSYPVCGSINGSTEIVSGNLFTETSQATPTISLPTTATSGDKITIIGANWQPSGTQVEILTGPQGSNGCATSLITLTSQSDGTLSGSFTAPTVTKTTSYLIVAVSPIGTCSGTVKATLRATATVAISAGSANTGGTPVPTATGTGHSATATPVSPNGNPGPTCAPNSSTCNTFAGIPWWVICLILLALLLLFLLLLWLLARRRNQEVIVSEEDITSTIADPNSIAPMGNMRFLRVVRVTKQTVDSATGAIRDTQISVFDEFADASGGTRRRPHV